MMEDVEQLTKMFEQMGSEPKQAEVMARQLLKRAEQIAEREGIDKLTALSRLLQIVKAGREGETFDGNGN